MTKPMRPAEFQPSLRRVEAGVVDGVPVCLDAIADRGPPSHAFLRHAWFSAAVEAYGRPVRAVVARDGGEPVLAIPYVPKGPAFLGLASVAGCYWPFRSFPSASDDEPVLAAALDALAREVRALRIGPVADGDPSAAPLVEAARARGWTVLERPVAESWLFGLGEATRAGGWPRASTLKKNRFHEKHLGAHGALDWRFAGGDDWPDAFDALASVEERSWIASETDGSDAKFTRTGHGAFWRACARDEALRGMMHAALLTVDGAPAAFSFDLLAGTTCYAVANSYDPAYAKHSPGKLLYMRNLVDLAGQGVETVDWGMGDSGYKQVIGAEAGPVMRDRVIVRPGLDGWAARIAGRYWRR